MARREQRSNRETKKPKKEKSDRGGSIDQKAGGKRSGQPAAEALGNAQDEQGPPGLGGCSARLPFEKPLAELDRSERAEPSFLRALDAKASDEALVERHPDAALICSLPTKQVQNRPLDGSLGCGPAVGCELFVYQCNGLVHDPVAHPFLRPDRLHETVDALDVGRAREQGAGRRGRTHEALSGGGIFLEGHEIVGKAPRAMHRLRTQS